MLVVAFDILVCSSGLGKLCSFCFRGDVIDGRLFRAHKALLKANEKKGSDAEMVDQLPLPKKRRFEGVKGIDD